MKIRECVKYGADVLKNAGLEEYRFESEYLLAESLGIERITVITDGERELDKAQEEKFLNMVSRRSKREPAAYITGHREFMGLDFQVQEGILIPRPDTEILVEEIIETVKNKNLKTSVEVGLGSGCISISIAKYTALKCFGTDISETAVAVSKKNAKNNGVENKTEFYLGDVFKGLPNGKYDIIVSNPPYIRKKDMAELMADVKDYEPYTALCGGDDGLDFYRRITEDGYEILNDGGYIFYEIGYDEAEEVSDILKEKGFCEIRVVKDLSGLDRVVMARKGDLNV